MYKIAGLEIFPSDDREQEIRLKRFFFGTGVYLMNASFVVLCWRLDYFSAHIAGIYMIAALVLNVGFFVVIRSGLNKRFRDPSLTFAQMSLSALPALFMMYFAGEARGTFLLLGVSMLAFGMFSFKTRHFLSLALLLLTGYALLILLLERFNPASINLRVESLQWMALAVTLIQFSFLAGFVSQLRSNVRAKNQELAAQNLELAIALQRINDMAIRDDLTGVYNRRYLMERIAEETQRCLRNGSAYSIGMIDIDFFKKVNDTYGHPAGDEVLRRVSVVASEALRLTDCFGRFGGEEFLMVLIDTSMEGAMITAERVRSAVEALEFPEIDSNLHVTISIGVAEHARRTEAADTIKCADESLYVAKENGRNRSVAAPLS